ncbi:formate/nitrite transporter family protein [Jatrophihabitans sp. YIM 134969]
MSVNTPAEVAELAVASGSAKAHLAVPKMFVGGILAGAYIAFGSLLAIDVTAGMPKEWGGLITLFYGLVFSLGLILVIIGGAELLTGNMALVPLAAFRGLVAWGRLALNFVVVAAGNLVGSLLVAYVFAVKTGVIGTADSPAGTSALNNFTRLAAVAKTKVVTEDHLEIFLRAIACNWLVCLAVWLALAATTVSGKILAIVFPITAFVAIGFDHVVANMFFLPAALFVHAPEVTLANTVANLIFAFLGNLVGAVVFVASAYWYLYLYGKPEPAKDGAPAASRATETKVVKR